MLAEIALINFIIASVFALLLAVLPLLGVKYQDVKLMSSAKVLTKAVALFTFVSMALLVVLFLQDDFSVKIVSQTSHSQLPFYYKITALWGGHEGSLLLWIAILSWWMLAVAVFSKRVPIDMQAKVLAVMAWVFLGFAAFLLFTSSPFDRVLPSVPQQGKDLNPLLQDFGMIIHPPMLYFGYVGFSVAFAFAIAALISGEFDNAWLRWVRPWTTAAWGFLTLGIMLGSWWAYYELGWGGWWFWDPVENASFMPWLIGTALMHSLAVSEKRGLFKSWTILLAIFAFSLSLLGTFLVRSGVLTSVHAFAADPSRGLFILAFLAVVIGGSLTLYAAKAPNIVTSGKFSYFSKDFFLLLNNMVLVVACLTVLIGTLFPLLADALAWGKYSVGPPYFNKLFVPLMLLLITLLGFSVFMQWKSTAWQKLRPALLKLFLLAVLLLVAFLFLSGQGYSPSVVTGFAAAAWVLAAIVLEFVDKLRHASSFLAGVKRLPLSFYGMQLAHIGLVVTALGIAVVSHNSIEKDIKMNDGDSLTIADSTFIFHGVGVVGGPNYQAQQGRISFYEGDKMGSKSWLLPEKRFYVSQRGNVMTEAAIDASLARDFYAALGESLDDGSWSVRLQYKPYVRLIWLGGLLMVLGAIFSLLDKRYRQ